MPEEPVYIETDVGGAKLRVPAEGFYFNSTDCWVSVHGPNVRVGFSDVLRLDERAILSITAPEVGDEIRIYEEICCFGTDQVSLRLEAPVSGTVISVNQDVLANPALVKEDPYQGGWVVELEPSELDDELELLMTAEEYLRNARGRAERGPGCPCMRGKLHSMRKGQGA